MLVHALHEFVDSLIYVRFVVSKREHRDIHMCSHTHLVKIALQFSQICLGVKMRHVFFPQPRLLRLTLENEAKVLIDRPSLVARRLPEERLLLLIIRKAIYLVPEERIRARYLVRRDPHHRAVLLMQAHKIAVPCPPHRVVGAVEVCEFPEERAWDGLFAERAFEVFVGLPGEEVGCCGDWQGEFVFPESARNVGDEVGYEHGGGCYWYYIDATGIILAGSVDGWTWVRNLPASRVKVVPRA